MSKPPAKHWIPSPRRTPAPGDAVTPERIEKALDGLAKMMVDAGAAGRASLPLFQRLERELADMREADAAMAAVYARAQRARG